MNSPFHLSDTDHSFPAVELALDDPDGLLAVGGDLNTERLIAAYQQGIFPWYTEDQPLLWWSPDPRAVMYLNDFKPSNSLARKLRKHDYRVSCNKAFLDVIQHCANSPRPHQTEQGLSSWITDDMQQAYFELHQQGYAHSLEIWEAEQNTLIGGLYGISLGRVFCGESMFNLKTDASKIAFAHLVSALRSWDYAFIDCQVPNPHLLSLGCTTIPRKTFIQQLHLAVSQACKPQAWQANAALLQGDFQ